MATKIADLPDDVVALGESLGMSYALKINALGSPAMKRVIETLGQLRDKDGLRESQNSGCQNGSCARPFLDELLDVAMKR